MEICSKENCTACGACAYVCPIKCISMSENEIGAIYPHVDEKSCINCGKCKKVCPQINKVTLNMPIEAYAAWSMDEEERRTSASGGIAAEIYNSALKKQYYVVGASVNQDFVVKLEVTNDKNKLSEFKNSKYVFSEIYELYAKIDELVNNNEKIVVIALPCQIAAIKNVVKKDNNILYIDLVCHGTTPRKYLQQHIKHIEKECEEKAVSLSFRAPEKDTSTYYFALYNSHNKIFYAKQSFQGDVYQIGYHRSISCRDNCFNCIYARKERGSDITLSDYKGLGKLKECSYGEKKVSSILCNTEKGKKFIEQLIDEKNIFAEKRPTMEPIKGDPQLQHLAIKKKTRKDFEKYIIKYQGDFIKTMQVVVLKEKVRTISSRLKNRIKNVVRR